MTHWTVRTRIIAAFAENLRRMLSDWLNDMKLVQTGSAGAVDRYIGYMGSYAESHEALHADEAVQEELRNVARSLVDAVRLQALDIRAALERTSRSAPEIA